MRRHSPLPAWVAASLLTVALAFAHTALADETCGLPSTFDVIFANGFQDPGAITIPRPSLSELLQRKGAQVLTAPTIAITSPSAGAAFADNHIDAAGTYTGPDDTGIVVGTQIAYTHGGQFVAAAVPLNVGSNSLTATATTLDGQTATDSRSVTGAAQAPLILAVNEEVAFAPFKVKFQSQLSSGAIQTVGVDYDGDGTDDYTGSTLPSPFTHTYTTSGIYAVRLSIHTVGGQDYSTTHRVVIQDLTQVRSTVCGVFGYFRENLAVNDIATATQTFGEVAKSRYTAFLNGLGATNAATMATNLGTIANGLFGPDRASLVVAAAVSGQAQGYTVVIARGDDGVWRLTDF